MRRKSKFKNTKIFGVFERPEPGPFSPASNQVYHSEEGDPGNEVSLKAQKEPGEGTGGDFEQGFCFRRFWRRRRAIQTAFFSRKKQTPSGFSNKLEFGPRGGVGKCVEDSKGLTVKKKPKKIPKIGRSSRAVESDGGERRKR